MNPWPDEKKIIASFYNRETPFQKLKDLYPQFQLLSLKQTHSANVIIIDKENLEKDHEGDAWVTPLENIGLTIHTADCLPLLAYSNNIIGACHGGWRGLSQNILEAWVARLLASGATRDSLKIAAGPAIGPCHFEVKKDVSDLLLKNIPINLVSGIKKPHLDAEKDYIDLKALARFKLLKLGLSDKNLFFSEDCTFCDEKLYLSFRRDGAQKGQRLESIIVKPRH